MKQYTCVKCGKVFENNRKSKYCPECRKHKRALLSEEELEELHKKEKTRFKTHRLKLKKIALKYKGDKCQICGYNKCSRALQFHHVDPSTKKFDISVKGYTRSWEDVKKELDKCILVCSNYHAEIHNGDVDVSNISLEPVDVTAFNEMLDENSKSICNKKYLTDKNKADNKIIYNDKKYKKSTVVNYEKYASQFTFEEYIKLGISSRKTERPSTYIQFLMVMDSFNWNFCAVGRFFGVSDNAIRKWSKNYKKLLSSCNSMVE